jgi:hypothetical protein
MYEVTGVDVYGKRFKLVYTSYMMAMCINLWRGSVWERSCATSPRKLIKRVWN